MKIDLIVKISAKVKRNPYTVELFPVIAVKDGLKRQLDVDSFILYYIWLFK